jgi:hypothetical protein
MKRILLILALFIGFLNTSFAGDSPKCKIIIYRENSFYGSAIIYKVFANDSLLTRIKNNSFFVYNCFPGKYTLNINNNPESTIEINAEEGKTYYLRLWINMGFWTSRPELVKMDSELASKRVSIGKMHEISAKDNIYFRLKNRIGMDFGIGVGFNRIGLYPMTNGDTSYISFGGGYSAGLKYGRELNKYLDVAAEVHYQVSMLIPYLNNATTTFERAYVSITPSFILPIKDGENMRFKIGVGYDYYWYNVLDINSSKISAGGYDDIWYYKAASGFHASLNFEMNLGDRWSLNYGLKYYYTSFKYKSSSIRIPLTGNKLLDPSASGIDFIVGINYNF